MEHIRRLRLERAAQQLTTTEESVTRLAFAAGYETLDAFTRAFRDLFDVPPSVYRKERSVLNPHRPPSGVLYHPAGDLRDFEPISTGASTMEVQLKRLDAMRVAFVHEIGPYANSASKAWGKLCGWAGPRGLLGPNTRFIGVSYDSPDVTAPDKIRYDACVTVHDKIAAEGEIGVREIPGGLFASTVHKGPMEMLEKTYARLCGEWIPQAGYRFGNGSALEFYLTDMNTTKPEDQLTEICVPVEKSE
jgi:AraC family transcriptional regulator